MPADPMTLLEMACEELYLWCSRNPQATPRQIADQAYLLFQRAQPR